MFDKIYDVIGFRPSWTVELGINQVIEAFNNGKNSNYKDWEIKRLLSMLKFMKHEPDNKKELQQEFKIRTQFLDQYRNENFIEIVPELAEWYKSIKVLA